MAIPVSELAKQIAKELEIFAGATDEAVKVSVDDVAKATVQRLRQTSPKLTGDYAASWTATRLKGGRHYYGKVVHADDGEYRLTHLLEHGHALVRGGRTVGYVKAHPHIEAAEQAAIDSFIEEVRKKVEG